MQVVASVHVVDVSLIACMHHLRISVIDELDGQIDLSSLMNCSPLEIC